MANNTILIDTTILIEFLRKQHKRRTTFYRLSRANILSISTITEFEFRIGITNKHFEFANQLLDNLIAIPFDSACANIASKIYKRLKAQNKLIPPPDVFSAATAVKYAIPPSTLNKKH